MKSRKDTILFFEAYGYATIFSNRQNNANRALGLDMPSPSNSSSGEYFSSRAAGHLGFTGTSFWTDLDRLIVVILLTNRIHPTRLHEKIKAFRPKLHDAVVEQLQRHFKDTIQRHVICINAEK